jgi:2-alkenal reductase
MKSNNAVLAIVLLVLIACSGFTGAAAGGAAVYAYLKGQLTSTAPATVGALQPGSTTPSPGEVFTVDTSSIETAITKAVAKVGPAVVTVVTDLPDQTGFFGTIPGGQASGSGIILSDQGYIVTNNHVVDGGTAYHVIFQSGDQHPAKLVGADKFSDLAVLKVEAAMPAAVVLGNSDTLRPGETAIAIGSPLGDFKNSVTVGVISATGRSLDTGNGYQLEGLLQTDAAINEGNSGGPLVNLAGEVIGINTLIIRDTGTSSTVEGLGFSIPSNNVMLVTSQIIAKGYVSRPYIGIRYQPITPDIAARYRLPVQWGVYISDIISGSPAEKANLQIGDIITQLGGITLDANHAYLNTLYGFTPGQEIEVRFFRSNSPHTIKLVLTESQ